MFKFVFFFVGLFLGRDANLRNRCPKQLGVLQNQLMDSNRKVFSFLQQSFSDLKKLFDHFFSGGSCPTKSFNGHETKEEKSFHVSRNRFFLFSFDFLIYVLLPFLFFAFFLLLFPSPLLSFSSFLSSFLRWIE